jgi:hypothetical protein
MALVFPLESIFSLGVSCFTLGLLALRTAQSLLALREHRKLVDLLIFFQLLLVTARNLTVVFTVAVPNIDCLALTRSGWAIYPMWVVSAEAVLSARSLAFITGTWSKRAFKIFIALLWIARFSIGWYQVGTLQQLSEEGEFCEFTADFAIGDAILAIKLVTEVIILLAFVVKALEMVRNKRSADGDMWIRLSVHNGMITCKLYAFSLLSFDYNG